ncbi:MAG: hypothetical protein WA434_17600 [Candidatus Acidiferrales bacterium]
MCVGWCDSETSIDSKSVVNISKSPGDLDRCPEQKSVAQISKKDWRDVQALIDPALLAAIDEPLKQCPGCADEPVQWVKVDFSDGTEKGIAYNEGTGPHAITDFLTKLAAIERRPRPARFEGRSVQSDCPGAIQIQTLPDTAAPEVRNRQ